MRKKLPLIITILVLALFAAAYLYIPKTYTIYDEALELARQDQVVSSTIGNTINDSLFVYSRISKGMAQIDVPIAGEKGAGMLLIRGRKLQNEWKLTSVSVELESSGKRHSIYNSGK